jgi:hypothetical protein
MTISKPGRRNTSCHPATLILERDGGFDPKANLSEGKGIVVGSPTLARLPIAVQARRVLRSAEHRSARAPTAHDRLATPPLLPQLPPPRPSPAAPALRRCGPARILPTSGQWILPRRGYWRVIHGSRRKCGPGKRTMVDLVGRRGRVPKRWRATVLSKTLARLSCAAEARSVFGAPSIARPARPQPTTDSPHLRSYRNFPHVHPPPRRPSGAVAQRGYC